MILQRHIILNEIAVYENSEHKIPKGIISNGNGYRQQKQYQGEVITTEELKQIVAVLDNFWLIYNSLD